METNAANLEFSSDRTKPIWCRVSLALPLVFFVGVPVVLGTRLIHYISSPAPEYILPSISRTAAHAPGSYLFDIGMTVVALLMMISWWICRRVGKERILRHAPERLQAALQGLNSAASSLGMTAGLALVLLIGISLEDDARLHVVLGFVFFFLQITAFAADSVCYSLLKRSADNYSIECRRLSTVTRITLFLAIGALALLFMYMYFSKSTGLFGSMYLAQGVYILSEHLVVFLSMAYSAAIYPCIMRHVRHCGYRRALRIRSRRRLALVARSTPVSNYERTRAQDDQAGNDESRVQHAA